MSSYSFQQIVEGLNAEARRALIQVIERALAKAERVEQMLPIDEKFNGLVDCGELEALFETLREKERGSSSGVGQ